MPDNINVDGDELDYENNENTKTGSNISINNSASPNNINKNINYSNEIAGSVNSPDISIKLSEYINSNLPHIEKSINNHLANSDSTMSITNDLIHASSNPNNHTTDTPALFNNSPFIKTHRKQMSDESFHDLQVYRNSASNASSSNNNKRSLKKARSAANSKTMQTQSLSNIAVPALTHSASDYDLDLDKQQMSMDPDDNDVIINHHNQ